MRTDIVLWPLALDTIADAHSAFRGCALESRVREYATQQQMVSAMMMVPNAQRARNVRDVHDVHDGDKTAERCSDHTQVAMAVECEREK